MSGSTTPEQGTAGVQTPHPDAGTHTVSLHRDVKVRLVPVGHENGDEDYHVYLEPVSDGDPALGTVMPYRPDGTWYIHLAPRYGDGPVATVGGLELALRRLLELALDEDLNPNYVELPSRGDAAEEPEDEGKGLRDHPGISNGDVAQVRAYGAAHIALVSGFMDRFEDHLSPWALELIRRHMESALDHTERLIAAVQIQLDEEG